MDGESSYESDISESWSLVDLNSNGESLSANESNFELESSKTKKTDELELNDLVEICEEAKETDCNVLNDSDSNPSFVSEGLLNSYNHVELPPSNIPISKEDNEKNDSDIESIEILDLDGNCIDSEIDRLDSVTDSHDSQTYQSDDEESVEENIRSGCKSNISAVIKRKRRECSKNSNEASSSVNSEDKRPEKNDSNAFTNESTEGDSNELLLESSSHPVYKHRRNNVANAVLSLSVGVIFAGVACIAIGHFLGVQDAAENAGGLVETLRKLQAENAALQSRLFHLNRALLNREANSKPGLPPDKASCKGNPEVSAPKTDETDETDLNSAALSEIRSSLNSIEWLSELETLVGNENKATESGGVDFKRLGMYIHDQLDYLKSKKEGGIKLLEDADRKISEVLQKIVTRLSTSQENIEKLYNRLLNLKDKFNDKLNKIVPDPLDEVEEESESFERSAPVTERDLTSLQRKSGEEGARNRGERPGQVVLYEFPRPEKYYQVAVRNVNVETETEKKVEIRNSTEISKRSSSKKIEGSEKKGKKKHKYENEKRKHKKGGKINSRKGDSKEREERSENKNKRHKRNAKKFNAKQAKQIERNNKKEKIFDSESVTLTFGPDFNRTDSKQTRYFKADEEVVKGKRKVKKYQKAKIKKSNIPKAKRDYHEREKYSQPCSGFHCFNSTGYWVFKWTDGREEFRRRQRVGDWQFERAKARKELRDDGRSVNWQFERAKVRKELRRDDGRSLNWQFERASGRKNRHGGRWSDGKHTRFNGKEFFHKWFSWVVPNCI